MRTVLKWFANPHEEQRETIPLISRTLCKLAIVSKEYSGKLPEPGSFWWVQIRQETFARNKTGQSGCFVVEPVAQVEEQILRLIPGMYQVTVAEGIVIVRPTQNVNLPWIFPLNLRKKLAKQHGCHAVIVDLTVAEPGL